MARPKKNPEITKDNIGFNPFESDLVVNVTNVIKKVKNKYGNDDIDPYSYEATPFTKIFDVNGNKDVIDRLSIRGKELYLFLLHHIQGGKDYIHIDKKSYMKKMGIKSLNTFKVAVGELTKLYPADKYPKGEGSLERFIYPHSVFTDIYWINPKYFFKGSRIEKYPNSVKVTRISNK